MCWKKSIGKRGVLTMIKNGISPLIATVLLVGFTVVLIAIILLWGRGYYEERAQKEGKISELEADCATSVLLDVKSAALQGVKLILGLNNDGNRDIDGLVVVVQGAGGQEPIKLYGSQYRIKKFEAKTIETNYTASVGTPTEVKVIPALKAGQKYYVACDDKAVTYVF